MTLPDHWGRVVGLILVLCAHWVASAIRKHRLAKRDAAANADVSSSIGTTDKPISPR